MANTFNFGFQIDDNEQSFKVARFNGVEGISRLFHFEIFLVSESEDFPYYDELIGKAATLSISRDDDATSINGMVSRFLYLGYSGDTTSYFVELMPAVWLLTQRYGSRIFQDQTVLEIIEDVLKEGFSPGFMNYDFTRLRKVEQYKKREFCVQYRESDFNFISRLMEEEGIFYNFTHHVKPKDHKNPLANRYSHTLVLGNDPTCYPDICGKHGAPGEGEPKVKFVNETGLSAAEEHIYNINYNFQIRPGKATLRDHNYMRNSNLTPPAYTLSNRYESLEFYDYPGKFDEVDEGERLTHIRLQELRTQYELGLGQSNCLRLVPGNCFILDGHKYIPSTRKNLVVKVTHTGRDATEAETKNDWLTVFNWIDKGIDPLLSYLPTISIGPLGSISAQQLYYEYRKGVREVLTKKTFFYSNEFECIPSDTYYRPPRLTPKPVVQGPQTAIVVGPGNDKEDKAKKELYMSENKMGMAKVLFHWDRRKKDERNCSCWVRVAYNYAGQNHGLQFHPLIGDEVVVDFLEGDPDKPLIVGSVYNGDNPPPLQPEDMTGNIILTPYQHRLMLSDRETTITLNTGGGKDGNKKEVMQMVDGDKGTEFGNTIYLKTADNHQFRMAKGPQKGIPVSFIGVKTEQGHRIQLMDTPTPDSGIWLNDKTKNLIISIDSEAGTISIINKTDKEIILNCQHGNVSIIGGGVEVVGGNVHITGQKIVKINSSGSVVTEAPMIGSFATEEFVVDAPDVSILGKATVKINSFGDVSIDAPRITLKAETVISLDAPLVSCAHVIMCDTLMAEAVISKSYTPGAGNIL